MASACHSHERDQTTTATPCRPRLKGPGLNKQITMLSQTGSKTVTVTLKKGRYTYQCDPHVLQGMKKTFRVT